MLQIIAFIIIIAVALWILRGIINGAISDALSDAGLSDIKHKVDSIENNLSKLEDELCGPLGIKHEIENAFSGPLGVTAKISDTIESAASEIVDAIQNN